MDVRCGDPGLGGLGGQGGDAGVGGIGGLGGAGGRGGSGGPDDPDSNISRGNSGRSGSSGCSGKGLWSIKLWMSWSNGMDRSVLKISGMKWWVKAMVGEGVSSAKWTGTWHIIYSYFFRGGGGGDKIRINMLY